MKPRLGWAALSRNALKKAEAQLSHDNEGVRDELGLLRLHTGYANRFFPGTSTQQSRLRYALFVPWQIKSILQQRPAVSAREAPNILEQTEMKLALQLPNEEGQGTIGRLTARQHKPVSIPPSVSYWVALRTWGILGSTKLQNAPSRRELFVFWNDWREGKSKRPTTDDEGRTLEDKWLLFRSDLPPAQGDFTTGKQIDFSLKAKERDFLRKRMIDTWRVSDNQPTYLSALVRSGDTMSNETKPWSRRAMRHADSADKKAIVRARYAAALSAVTRAVYAASVEGLIPDSDRNQSVGEQHRNNLPNVVNEFGDIAKKLALSELKEDGIEIKGLEPVLIVILRWLSRGGRETISKEVIETLRIRECDRKGTRAKLSLSQKGREARARQKLQLAYPIDYRWNVVCQFLKDLQE